jgi:hypothetical protein
MLHENHRRGGAPLGVGRDPVADSHPPRGRVGHCLEAGADAGRQETTTLSLIADADPDPAQIMVKCSSHLGYYNFHSSAPHA